MTFVAHSSFPTGLLSKYFTYILCWFSKVPTDLLTPGKMTMFCLFKKIYSLLRQKYKHSGSEKILHDLCMP